MRDPSEKVVVGYLQDGRPFGAFMECMLDLQQYDFATHKRIAEGGGRLSYRAGCNLATPRNHLVSRFLEYGQADWLWMVDSDMTFSPDVVERLLEYADPVQAPIVGGLCFGFDENGDVRPTLYGLVGDTDDLEHLQVTRYHEWEPNTMMQVAGTGAACLLIHKTALERIRDFEARPGRAGFNPAYPWFQETEHDGKPVGEDITFCWRAIQAQVPVFVNTGVQLGHVKDRVLTMESYFLSRGLLAPTHAGATA